MPAFAYQARYEYGIVSPGPCATSLKEEMLEKSRSRGLRRALRQALRQARKTLRKQGLLFEEQYGQVRKERSPKPIGRGFLIALPNPDPNPAYLSAKVPKLGQTKPHHGQAHSLRSSSSVFLFPPSSLPLFLSLSVHVWLSSCLGPCLGRILFSDYFPAA